ncbi:MAG: ABC transporter permease [Flavobacteriales bacterium]|nr:ABC transporter permease [Flavobacteriales bacterium]
MRRFLSAYRKDWLILTRDRAGLALLFIMPLALTVIMALIQDAPFKTFQNSSIDVAVFAPDSGKYALEVIDALQQVEGFQIHTLTADAPPSSYEAFQAIVRIPESYSDSLTISNTSRIMRLADPDEHIVEGPKIAVEFDPAITPGFRELIRAHCHRVVSRVELKGFVEAYSQLFPQMAGDVSVGDLFPENTLEVASEENNEADEKYNSVQHNVPAYAIFGIFFIALALSGNLIKEREDGSSMRLRLIPASPWPLVLGRIAAYQTIAFLQALLVFLAGIFLMPLLGLPALEVGSGIPGVVCITLASGFAAAGMGHLLGTVFKSQQQAAATGAISIIILAALGGIWVPTFAMPKVLQYVSMISPLNWSMTAFQDILLRNQSVIHIWPQLLLLCAFATACAFGSVMMRKSV